MRKPVYITSVCLLIIAFAFPLFAQEKPRADEILRYFPDATYRSLSHSDFSRVSREEAYPLYKYMTNKQSQVGGRFSRQRSPLPEGMEDKEISSSAAVLVAYSTKEVTMEIELPQRTQAGPDARTRGRGGRIGGNFETFRKLREEYPGFSGFVGQGTKNDDGTSTVTIRLDEGDRMYVYRYDDVASIVAEALEKGDLGKTGKRIRKQPVYTFEGGGFRRFGSGTMYAITTPANELLIAGKLSTLRMMLSTADGAAPNLLENPNYIDLIGLVPEFGQSWNVFFPRLEIEERTEALAETGEYSDEQLETFEERMHEMPMMYISSMSVDAEVRLETIRVYESEEYAESSASLSTMLAGRSARTRGNQQGDSEQQSFIEETKERMTETRKGNIVHQTLIFDREYVKSMADRREEMMKQWEERRKEREERRKESGESESK